MDSRLYMPRKIQEDHFDKINELFASENHNDIPRQLINLLEVYDHFKIDIAVTGDSGSGKSTLINTLLGLHPDDTGAAPTGVVETTMQPSMYQHPNLTHVRLWDLPGMGTPSFTSDSYVKEMNFDLYDTFIVVMSERVRENNMLVIDAILQQKKPFYVIRTKIDNDMQSQRKKRDFSETRALDHIRQDCQKYLMEMNLDTHVFLVAAHEPLNYDMKRLTDILRTEVPRFRAEAFIRFLEKLLHSWWKPKHVINHAQQTGKFQAEDITAIQNIYKRTGFGAVKIKVVLEALNHFELDVAVLGEKGSGASTLVNALRGLQNGACGGTSAPINNPAISPAYLNVRFWDMSGIEEYMDYSMYEMKQVLKDFDFYIIIASGWQKARHIKLAKAVGEIRKHFLLVQTKVDCHLQAQRDLCCAETEMLDGLRAQYTQELKRARLADPQIFLINSLDRNEFDFVGLESALSSDLDTIRTSAFAYYVAKIVREKN